MAWAFYNSDGELVGGHDGAWTFYDSDGSSQVVLPPTSILAAGADKEVQFNDSGVLGADPDFTFDKSTSILTLSGEIIVDLIRNSIKANLPVDELTMSGTLTLAEDTSLQYQFLDPDGSNRDVVLPAEAIGLAYVIANLGNAGEVITVKNDASGTEETLNNLECLTIISGASTWAFKAKGSLS
jgi:hypothetical protein